MYQHHKIEVFLVIKETCFYSLLRKDGRVLYEYVYITNLFFE